jgi:hypothetical protein
MVYKKQERQSKTAATAWNCSDFFLLLRCASKQKVNIENVVADTPKSRSCARKNSHIQQHSAMRMPQLQARQLHSVFWFILV